MRRSGTTSPGKKNYSRPNRADAGAVTPDWRGGSATIVAIVACFTLACDAVALLSFVCVQDVSIVRFVLAIASSGALLVGMPVYFVAIRHRVLTWFRAIAIAAGVGMVVGVGWSVFLPAQPALITVLIAVGGACGAVAGVVFWVAHRFVLGQDRTVTWRSWRLGAAVGLAIGVTAAAWFTTAPRQPFGRMLPARVGLG